MTAVHPPRVFLIVLDGVGVGALPDAEAYGDAGSDTLGNLARLVPLRLPTLRGLGLGRVARLGGDEPDAVRGAFCRMAEASAGKDSMTGHWELMGLVLDRPFPVYPDGFPPEVIDQLEARIGRRTLGNRRASGTVIIEELGEEHLRTGSPIVYTSADSVLQIAAHEAVVSVDTLYRICEVAFDLVVRGLGVGRVIARPFVGEPGSFKRTARRHDFAAQPGGETLLDRLSAAGVPVTAIGKIHDLFGGRGIGSSTPTASDRDGMRALAGAVETVDRGLVFANLVDFDSVYGHRNDPAGFAANLERFDAELGAVLHRLGPGDVLAVTADHGNDPTTPSTDHSREFVPLLMTGSSIPAGLDMGVRSTFADLGQSLAEAFGVGPLAGGTSFWGELTGCGRGTSSGKGV